jgi:hypothetical protein
MSICPTSGEGARTARGGGGGGGGASGGMRPREILKCRASKMPFPAFWGEILCLERARNEEKINETRPCLMTILIS